MNYLNKEELCNINGGGIRLSIVVGLAAAGAFIIGLLDGLTRPYSCR